MRISQIMLGKGFGGAERSFVDTALALAARGHAVQAICHAKFSKRDLLENVPNLELYRVNAGGEWDFWTPRKIEKLLLGFGAEIVHTQLKRAAWHGGRAAKRAGVPVVAKLHNYVQLARYKYVHTLFCTTQDQRRHVLEANWPEDRVEVVPNFSRIESVDFVKKASAGPLRILTYGRYVPKKGFDVLLRAFRSLLDAGIDAQLVIGGQGSELAALQALAAELKLSQQVELGVWIDDVSDALSMADLFVLPSLDEPFGVVMLEAMASGVPIVSTKTKGPLEVLNAGTAILVEIGSEDDLFKGMLAVANDRLAADKRAETALQLYRDCYYEAAVIPRIEALYRRVIAAS
ncbi:MAG TPA: glycosyltransferase [Opitutae bacterium]|nr:glycosyl transferase [Puniceicoccaceae bacterium]HBR94045.1 glycosyltransferase [Opitutae bacterium]